MEDQIEWLAPENVEPPHDVSDVAKLAAIVASMREEPEGWVGRPIVVIRVSGVYQAITGSHRIAAAREVMETIPCLVLDERQSAAVLGPSNQVNYDDSASRLAYAGFEDVAELVAQN